MVRLKVLAAIPGYIEVTTFQFLMVRLKGFIRLNFLKNKEISIPYGAIKRKLVNYTINQILNFNSLWCD